MDVQHECIYCSQDWEWRSDTIFDFNLSIGKRIWPAVCLNCRKELERKYRSGEINRTQLIMEFSTISARIAKKCAVKGNVAILKLKEFRPRGRGKN